MAHGRGAFADRIDDPLGQRNGGGVDQGTHDAIEIALRWGDTPLEVKQFRHGQVPTVGHLPTDSIHLFSRAVGAGFELVRDGELRVPPGARVVLLKADGSRSEAPVDDDVQALPLLVGERAELSIGALTLSIRRVPMAPRVPAMSLAETDFGFFKLASITAIAAAAFLVALSIPSGEDEVMDDAPPRNLPINAVKSIVTPKPEPLTLPTAPTTTTDRRSASATQPLQRTRAPVDPRNVGLLKTMRELGGGAGGVFAPGGLGEDLDNATANLGRGGHMVATGDGLTGVGSRGNGPGGPGPGIGFKFGLPGGGDGPRGVMIGGPKASLKPMVSAAPEKTTVVGGLDRDQIAKVIRDHQREIKHCYESALNQSPELEGKVAVMFTIDPAGEVADATVAETTLGSDSAESCIVQRIRRWRFPEPRGGGVVTVNFPWLFRPAGAE